MFKELFLHFLGNNKLVRILLTKSFWHSTIWFIKLQDFGPVFLLIPSLLNFSIFKTSFKEKCRLFLELNWPYLSLGCRLQLIHRPLNIDECSHRLFLRSCTETEECTALHCSLHIDIRWDLIQQLIIFCLTVNLTNLLHVAMSNRSQLIKLLLLGHAKSPFHATYLCHCFMLSWALPLSFRMTACRRFWFKWFFLTYIYRICYLTLHIFIT